MQLVYGWHSACRRARFAYQLSAERVAVNNVVARPLIIVSIAVGGPMMSRPPPSHLPAALCEVRE